MCSIEPEDALKSKIDTICRPNPILYMPGCHFEIIYGNMMTRKQKLFCYVGFVIDCSRIVKGFGLCHGSSYTVNGFGQQIVVLDTVPGMCGMTDESATLSPFTP